MKTIRHPEVAGYFYPADPGRLKLEVKALLEGSKPFRTYEQVFGIVAPHAGYLYSGRTAAYAYNLIYGKKIKRVIILSPSHSEYFPGVCIYEGDAYETPLGIIDIDIDGSEKMIEGSKSIFKGLQGHRREHALEVQLPFLQSVISGFKIIPVVIGDQSKIFIDELARQIVKIYDSETLIVASSDLSHFHDADTANVLDSIVAGRIQSFEYDLLQRDLENNNCEACGGGPIVAMMEAAALMNINGAEILNRSDSGDVTGDKKEVVGYLSAVVFRN